MICSDFATPASERAAGVFARFMPRVPAPLLVAVSGIVCAYLLNLQDRGVELVGHVPRGVPFLVRPVVDNRAMARGLGIALMSFTETVAAGRAFSRDDDAAPRASRELVATGLAMAYHPRPGAT